MATASAIVGFSTGAKQMNQAMLNFPVSWAVPVLPAMRTPGTRRPSTWEMVRPVPSGELTQPSIPVTIAAYCAGVSPIGSLCCCGRLGS